MKFSCHWFGISILQLVDRLVAEVKSSKQIGLLILVLDQFIFGEEFSRCVAEPLLGGIIFHYLVLKENDGDIFRHCEFAKYRHSLYKSKQK